jgi:hypothetical protein
MIQSLDSEAAPYRFTPREFQRLLVYRAAVAASFYTDRREASVRLETLRHGNVARLLIRRDISAPHLGGPRLPRISTMS